MLTPNQQMDAQYDSTYPFIQSIIVLKTEWFRMWEFRFRSSERIICWEWVSYCEQTLMSLQFLRYRYERYSRCIKIPWIMTTTFNPSLFHLVRSAYSCKLRQTLYNHHLLSVPNKSPLNEITSLHDSTAQRRGNGRYSHWRDNGTKVRYFYAELSKMYFGVLHSCTLTVKRALIWNGL